MYLGCKVCQEQCKMSHPWAEWLTYLVCRSAWFKHWELQRQVRQGNLFLVETYRNIPCNYSDFSPMKGKGKGDDAKADVILFCKKKSWLFRTIPMKPEQLWFWNCLCCPGARVQGFLNWNSTITLYILSALSDQKYLLTVTVEFSSWAKMFLGYWAPLYIWKHSFWFPWYSYQCDNYDSRIWTA